MQSSNVEGVLKIAELAEIYLHALIVHEARQKPAEAVRQAFEYASAMVTMRNALVAQAAERDAAKPPDEDVDIVEAEVQQAYGFTKLVDAPPVDDVTPEEMPENPDRGLDRFVLGH